MLPSGCLFTVRVWVSGQCQLWLLIQVVFAVILSSRCKHLQLFTVKCPLCSPSLPVCFHHYSTCCTLILHNTAAFNHQRSLTGSLQGTVSHEKINTDWPRHYSPQACATAAPAKTRFFKQEWSLFNSCRGSQAADMQNREDFLNRNLRMGILLKVLNQLNIKYKPMQC